MANSPLQRAVVAVILILLFWVAACSTGTKPASQPTSLTPAQQEEQNPEFWPMWEERRGLGG